MQTQLVDRSRISAYQEKTQLARSGSPGIRKPVLSRVTQRLEDDLLPSRPVDDKIDDVPLEEPVKPWAHYEPPQRQSYLQARSGLHELGAKSRRPGDGPALPKKFSDEHEEKSHEEITTVEQLQYHHAFKGQSPTHDTLSDDHPKSRSRAASLTSGNLLETRSDTLPEKGITRPISTIALGSEIQRRERSLTPQELQDIGNLRGGPGSSPGQSKRTSQVDLLNIPYDQQAAHHHLAVDNSQLRGAIGTNVSLLDVRKTLDMYRANVKRTQDPVIQYEFAVFMVHAAQQTPMPDADGRMSPSNDRAELLSEAKQILQKLADRTHVYAQYYLADGYFSGLFNKGKEDYEKAFPLFLSAGKHGHAEAAYRAGLCYEFGWGCSKNHSKAAQFFRHAATRNHSGASTRLGLACLYGDMGLTGRQREGIRWLKRASESADVQHNQAPFELGLLHVNGYGDEVFRDETHAAQLFTQAAELGHPEANLMMGEAYEHGLLTCPRDPALSIHFYNGAAQGGIAKAMMALCAWYMVGAEPVLPKDEMEAYEWAKQAAQHGYPKAEYAVGYFTEMGIGCRRDPLEANVWYVRAADNGEEHAKQRLAIIRAAETGNIDTPGTSAPKNEVAAKPSKKMSFATVGRSHRH